MVKCYRLFHLVFLSSFIIFNGDTYCMFFINKYYFYIYCVLSTTITLYRYCVLICTTPFSHLTDRMTSLVHGHG